MRDYIIKTTCEPGCTDPAQIRATRVRTAGTATNTVGYYDVVASNLDLALKSARNERAIDEYEWIKAKKNPSAR